MVNLQPQFDVWYKIYVLLLCLLNATVGLEDHVEFVLHVKKFQIMTVNVANINGHGS